MSAIIQLEEFRLYEKLTDLGYKHFSSDRIKEIVDCSEIVTFNKKDFFVDETMKDYIHLVIKGAFRYYVKDSNNKNRILRFSFRQDILFSFGIAEETLYTQATRECTVLKIKVENLFPNTIERNTFMLELKTRAIHKVENELLLSKLGFEQRYIRMKEQYKDFINLISTNDLASYLNVSPQTLCKVKSLKTLLLWGSIDSFSLLTSL